MEYFVAVAGSGSFSWAAEQLNVSQPGLSQQLRQLEREVGARLIDRLPRSVVLTEAGRVYLPEARAALLAASRARRAVQASVSGLAGDLEIATITSIAAGVLPTALRQWRTVRLQPRRLPRRQGCGVRAPGGRGDPRRRHLRPPRPRSSGRCQGSSSRGSTTAGTAARIGRCPWSRGSTPRQAGVCETASGRWERTRSPIWCGKRRRTPSPGSAAGSPRRR
ncbi:LysR family transcriptional regulator [Amycolatopsis sp.]|uniref:LysR family transcriptional regulator n=1 Tax=Amycolatopsis sp. TaxID=37632 RepID=UPI002639BFC8|nr:LysR family transcriptional regulator [Amycolatopsis sp.]